ncbi:MAG: sialate O-acetylesterase [Bdellovibrionota bacterium]
MRVKLDAQPGALIYMSKWDEAGASRSFSFDQGNAMSGGAQLRIVMCSNSTCTTSLQCVSNYGALTTGIATTIAVSVDFSNQTCRVYVDGADVTTNVQGTWPASFQNSTADWTVGGRHNGQDNRDFDGVVDDFFIDNATAWTSEQIWAWHNGRASSGNFPSGTTVATACRGGDDNGGAGGVCQDYTANNHDWALSDGVTHVAAVHSKITAATASSSNALRQNYIVLGQSNASGRGSIAQLTGAEYPNAARIYNYANDGTIVNPAVEPIDSIAGQSAIYPASIEGGEAGVGPALKFADEMADYWPNHTIGLLPCAQGASKVGGYGSSNWTPATVTNRLFGECFSRISTMPAGEIAGVIVYQGESDASNLYDAQNWAYRWSAVIQSLRDRLNNKYLPVVFVQLAGSGPAGANYAYWNELKTNQSTVCNLLSHCALVSAPSGPYAIANLHLATSAQLELGARIATAMKTLDYTRLVTP